MIKYTHLKLIGKWNMCLLRGGGGEKITSVLMWVTVLWLMQFELLQEVQVTSAKGPTSAVLNAMQIYTVLVLYQCVS